MIDPRIVAGTEPAGSNHYRSFVGPPERFDLVGAGQFALLHLLGLRDYHKLLDFGCGSLRLGRLLIPFLQRGGYFGIEPNSWLVNEGFSNELGEDARALKQPRFAENSDFGCDVFNGQRFDFVVAQSIFTHTGASSAQMLMDSIGTVLKVPGLAVFNFKVTVDPDDEADRINWKYPDILSYTDAQIEHFAYRAGLVVRSVGWPHPGPVRWFVAGKSISALPNQQLLDAMDIVPHLMRD